MSDASNKKHSSHIFKHWAVMHPDLLTMPEFKFSVVRSHKAPLDRQLHEAVRIQEKGVLNSKSEFRQNQIKRLTVNFTDRERKVVESELDRADSQTALAMKLLSNKVDSNIVSLTANAALDTPP